MTTTVLPVVKCKLKLVTCYNMVGEGKYFLMQCDYTTGHIHTVPGASSAGWVDVPAYKIWGSKPVASAAPATKTPATKEQVAALGRALEGEKWIADLVRYALNFFDLEGKKADQVRGFDSLVKTAAYGVALIESKLEYGIDNPRPARGPVIVTYNSINRTYDCLISYKAVKALGLKYKYSGRSNR